MRSIVNISLPQELNTLVDAELAKGHFGSKSEFFRNLLRLWLESKLAGELEESRKELKSGKGKLLKKLSDLR